MSQPSNEAIRMAADNGKSEAVWQENRLKYSIKSELAAIEQLADRIGFQCSALMRLAEAIPGYQYDQDGLRVIRLAVHSMNEALVKVEQTARQIDLAEFGIVDNQPPIQVKLQYGTSLEDIETMASDVGMQANAESYMLTLLASRRRPSRESMSVLRHLVNSMRSALG